MCICTYLTLGFQMLVNDINITACDLQTRPYITPAPPSKYKAQMDEQIVHSPSTLPPPPSPHPHSPEAEHTSLLLLWGGRGVERHRHRIQREDGREEAEEGEGRGSSSR